jgi:hypothetical protein
MHDVSFVIPALQNMRLPFEKANPLHADQNDRPVLLPVISGLSW